PSSQPHEDAPSRRLSDSANTLRWRQRSSTSSSMSGNDACGSTGRWAIGWPIVAGQCHDPAMRLRLYHHRDGARVAYRETGTGPGLVLLHSLGLSHREWGPVVAPLSGRFRVVLPDLPLHGDSEDRPRHPYTAEWMAEVIAGFCREVAGPRPLLAGHEIGAEVALRAVIENQLRPAKLVLMSNRLHRRDPPSGKRVAWRLACKTAALPGLDRLLSHGAKLVFRPQM